MSGTLRGVGLALVEVPRFRAVLERRGDSFAERVFSPGELAYSRGKKASWQNLAARFAAKVAGRAALRPALGRTLPLAGLEVTRLRSGAPVLAFTPRAEVSESLVFQLSITHDGDFALASVWVESP